jgi:ribosomal RNA-processing protein 9
LALSADGAVAFTGSKDCSLVRWDVAGGTKHKYAGRRKTKADALRQALNASRGTGTGVLPVLSSGYGGGRLGGAAAMAPSPASSWPSSAAAASAGAGGAAAATTSTAGTAGVAGPRVFHRDGVSTIVVQSKSPKSAESLAAIAKLRGVPDYGIVGHFAEVLAVALSSDGQYVVSGGRDRVLRVWDPRSGANIENLVGHKDALTSLIFRAGSHTVYTGSADRTVKLWNLDEMAYIDTLFGHQAEVNAVHALSRERCVTVGRDHTARLWKIPEQTQLVFRANASTGCEDVARMITESWFITGAQNGSLSLWSLSKKKPVCTVAHAHGDGRAPFVSITSGAAASAPAASSPSSSSSAAAPAPPLDEARLRALAASVGAEPDALSGGYCNWITALAALPNTDLVATGSGDGFIRLWRLLDSHSMAAAGARDAARDGSDAEDQASDDERAPVLASKQGFRGMQQVATIPVRGVVNGLEFSADGRLLVAAVGQEHRLGRWWRYAHARNGLVVIPLPAGVWANADAAASARAE